MDIPEIIKHGTYWQVHRMILIFSCYKLHYSKEACILTFSHIYEHILLKITSRLGGWEGCVFK